MELLDAVVLIERYIRREGIDKDEITVGELLEKCMGMAWSTCDTFRTN